MPTVESEVQQPFDGKHSESCLAEDKVYKFRNSSYSMQRRAM